MKEMYLVGYTTGEYDDYCVVNVFVTDEESIAEKWVEKFNNKLNIWKPFYEKTYNSLISLNDYREHYVFERYYVVCEINTAFYKKIEYR